jgi:hypothetical protein
LPEQTINPEIKLGRRSPKLAALVTKFFEKAERLKPASAIFGA